jgi:hypothetical protein
MKLGVFMQLLQRRSFDPVRDCGVYRDKEEGSCVHVDGLLCEETCSMRREYELNRAHVPLLKASGDDPIVYQYRHYEASDYVAEASRGWQPWKTCSEQELYDIRTYITRGNKYQIRVLRESRVEGYSPP